MREADLLGAKDHGERRFGDVEVVETDVVTSMRRSGDNLVSIGVKEVVGLWSIDSVSIKAVERQPLRGASGNAVVGEEAARVLDNSKILEAHTLAGTDDGASVLTMIYIFESDSQSFRTTAELRAEHSEPFVGQERLQ